MIRSDLRAGMLEATASAGYICMRHYYRTVWEREE